MSLTLDKGTVYGSGENKYWAAVGQKGASDIVEFTAVKGLEDIKIIQVSAGAEFSTALSEDGNIYAWGNPQYGQLGDGSVHECNGIRLI